MKESTAGSGKARKYTSPERFEERTSSDILNRHIKKEGVDGVKNKVLIVDRGGGCSFFDKGMSCCIDRHLYDEIMYSILHSNASGRGWCSWAARH